MKLHLYGKIKEKIYETIISVLEKIECSVEKVIEISKIVTLKIMSWIKNVYISPLEKSLFRFSLFP